MTDAEILEIAKQVGADEYEGCYELLYEELIAFARLIAAAQREEDARIVETTCNPLGHSFGHWSVMKEKCAAAIRNSGGAA